MRAILRFVTRVQVLLAVLALTVLFAPPQVERYGDRLQIALPVLALACESNAGAGAEFVLRYAAMFTLAHGSKITLGDAGVNQRPGGGGKGFPSAHTATAVLGASALVQGCLRHQPMAQGIVLLTAGFVGRSRIEAGKHDIWQVLGGALLGWGCDRVLRRPSARRAQVQAGLRRLGAPFGRAVRAVSAAIRARVRRWRGISAAP